MNEFYTHLEIQVNAEGVKSCIPTIYDNLSDAKAKYYAVMAVAATSGLPYHGSFVLRSDGVCIYGDKEVRAVEAPVEEVES